MKMDFLSLPQSLLNRWSNRIPKRVYWFGVGVLLGLVGLLIMGLLVLSLRYRNRIYPGILIGPVVVSDMTQAEARQVVESTVTQYLDRWPISFQVEQRHFSISLHDEVVFADSVSPVHQAYYVGRSLSLSSIADLIRLSYAPITFPLPIEVDVSWFETIAASIAAEVDQVPVPPRIEVVETQPGEFVAVTHEGSPGKVMDQDRFVRRLVESVGLLRLPEPAIEMISLETVVTPEQLDQTAVRANRLLPLSLSLTVPDASSLKPQEWRLAGKDLVQFLAFDGGVDELLLTDYVTEVAETINRPAKDAKFAFDEASGKVSEFVVAEDGLRVEVVDTVALIAATMEELLKSQESNQVVELVVETYPPQVRLEDVNRLGIRERLGVGTSTYFGSILSRVHNVALAAARLNGTLIPPGEEFSFNGAVGEISAATGYQAAYIISGGRTVLGDGGGVCQDSTTVFRAALDAGLPITQRRAHAYRVGYYEQDAKPGLDATVYSPTTDFRFLNDTPGHILLQAYADSPNRTLTVVLYGTSDGRSAAITDHVVWDVTPPLPDVYVDDPTLAPGQVKQVDWRASGAKAKFSYTVTRNGETIYEKTFSSVYRPWAAVFLRGVE